MTNETSEDWAGTADGSLGSLFVTRLLDHLQVPRRQRIAKIEEALGLSYQQARRRLNGKSDWTLEELRDVAAHFKRTLAELVGTGEPAGRTIEPETGTGRAPAVPQDSALPEPSATLLAGSLKVPCTVLLGDLVKKGHTGLLVAIRQPADDAGEVAQWMVLPATEALGMEAREVRRLSLTAIPPVRKRIAVLDDDHDLAETIATYMSESGYDATPFFDLDVLADAIETAPFDGYVVDWLVKKKSAGNLIAQIRGLNPSCPVVVLTGQLTQGNVAETDLAQLAAKLRFQYYEKPCRTSNIIAALEFAFDRQALA